MAIVMDRVAPVERIVGTKEGQVPWAREAIGVLRETASKYNATITYSDLAEQVQLRTGLRTRSQPRSWIGGVLGMVILACHKREMPPLSALVVHKHDGQVGNGYSEVLRVAGLPAIDDLLERERHAADSRLACYRKFCPDLPEDASPTLTAQVQVKATKAAAPRKAAVVEIKAEVCQSCWMQMPLDGRACPNCD